MPAYNAEKNIIQAIDSVKKQTYQNWELIIINDCSKDNTLSIIKDISNVDDRITVYDLKENVGVAGARNYGLKRINGDYVAFLDSDDFWVENKLETQIEDLKSKNGYFSICPYFVVDEEGKFLNKMFTPPSVVDWKSQLYGSKIGTVAVLIDTRVTGTIQMPKIGHEDYVTWQSILKKFGPAHSTTEPLAYYREGSKTVSSNKARAARWQFDIYREQFGYGFLKSSYYFVFYAINGFLKYKKINSGSKYYVEQ